MRTLFAFILAFTLAGSLSAQTTWYVRPDGGSRSTCDGKTDAAASGTKGGQHCAFGDYRWLYDDQKGHMKWVINGGDKVILRGGPWREGFNQGTSATDVWGSAGLGARASEAPDIPSGTAAMHTQILGENYSSCSATNKTQIFGGFGLYHVVGLGSSAFVDVECLEITSHGSCVQHGYPVVGKGCSTDLPYSDFATEGITTGQGTRDVLLQDVWVHNFVDRGVIGPIGGVVTCVRCDIAFNGMGGWEFDDGTGNGKPGDPHQFGTPSINNATWNFLNSTIRYAGCLEAYPKLNIALACYGQSSSGYGDGVGTPPGTALNVKIDGSVFHHSTQDCIDVGHIDTGSSTLSITNSQFYACNGQQAKWGYNFSTVTFSNNTVLGNCNRMSAPISDFPTTFNQYLQDFCRAGSTMSWNYRDGSVVNYLNNTVITYGPLVFVLGCSTAGGCPKAVTNFKGNIILGVDNPGTYNMGGQAGGPEGFYCQDNTNVINGGAQQTPCANMGVMNRANNTWFDVRGITLRPTELGSDPKFVGEVRKIASEAAFDVYTSAPLALSAGSPAAGQGATGSPR